MDVLSAFADILAETGENEPWFIEAKDSNPASELQRQMTFLSMIGQLGPSCDVLAIPNAGKASDWERIQRWKEGARAGALDLLFIDHDKNAYLPDLLSIVGRGWLHPGSIVVADNVLVPGSPKYRAYMRRSTAFDTKEHRTHAEYTKIPDLVLESTYRG